MLSKKMIAIIIGALLAFSSVFFFIKHNNEVALKVGEEKIFSKDYKNFSQLTINDQSVKDQLSRKFIRESILLQAGAKEGLVELDESIFNSKNMDLKKRASAASQIKNRIENDSIAIEGEYIAIWFDNVEVRELDYYEAKNLAFRKINYLYHQVKNGKMTMVEAGEHIRNDVRLASIDKAYKKNAYIEFKKMNKERISFSPEFSDAMWQLNEGELSEVIVAKDMTSDRGFTEAIYLFGKVNKINEPKYISFASWYQQAHKEHKIEKFY